MKRLAGRQKLSEKSTEFSQSTSDGIQLGKGGVNRH